MAEARAILDRLSQDPQRDRLRTRAERFSVETAAAQYLELFDALVA